jgi:hypothetical protein
MYAAHFAAALAFKSFSPKAPTWALLTGAFLPDLFWIAFGLAGIEPSQGPAFFDDWSHSRYGDSVGHAVCADLLAKRMGCGFPSVARGLLPFAP